MKAAAERLVQKEAQIRARVLNQIKTRIQAENEEARKRGLIEAKDDPEILRLAKLEAIKKAEQEQIDEENKQITRLSETLKNNQ